jgi:hypothetical protein
MDVSACFVFVEHDAPEWLPQLDEIVEPNNAVEVAMGHWGQSTRRALCDFAERETLRSAIIVVGHGDAARQPARMAARAVLARELISRMALGHFTSLTFVAVNRSSELERELLAVAETLVGEFRRATVRIRFVDRADERQGERLEGEAMYRTRNGVLTEVRAP